MRTLSQLRPTRAAGLTLLGISRRPQPAGLASPFSSALPTPHVLSRLPQRRLFNAGDIIEPITEAAQGVMLSVHGVTGLPWFAVIPIIALSVNMLFRMPFTAHSQIIMKRRAQLDPVLKGWTVRLWHEVAREKVPHEKIQREVSRRFKKESSRLFALLGLQQWKMYLALLGVPFWICNLVGLRKLCGMNGIYAQPGSKVASTAVGTDALGDPSSNIVDGVNGLASTPADLATSAADLAGRTAPGLEPTLTTEGFLWLTDLTASDPYYVLPITFTILTLANLVPQDKAARKIIFPNLDKFLGRREEKEAAERPQDDDAAKGAATVAERPTDNWRVRLVRAIAVCSPGLVLFTASFPAAVHLYTITSASVTLAFKMFLSKIAVTDAKIKPCVRRDTQIIRPKIGAGIDSKGV